MNLIQVLTRLSARFDWVLSVLPAIHPRNRGNGPGNNQVFAEDRAVPAMSSQRIADLVMSPAYSMPSAPSIGGMSGTPRSGDPRYGGGPVRRNERAPSSPLRRVALDGERPTPIQSAAVASAVQLADFLVVLIAGAASFAMQPGIPWPLPLLPGLTAGLVLALMARGPRRGGHQPTELTQQGFSKQFGEGGAHALSAFGFALVAAVAVLQPDPAERAALVAWLLFWAVAAVAGIAFVRVI